MDWMDLAQDTDKWRAHLIAVIKIVVPKNAGNFLTRRGTVCLSDRTLPHGRQMLSHIQNTRLKYINSIATDIKRKSRP